MEIKDIVSQLNNRFLQPLPLYHKRRIIFWYDEKGEFKEEIVNIHLDNAQVVILDGTNSFEVKKLINRDNLTDNLLIYDPLTYEKNEYDWLIDVKEYRSDITISTGKFDFFG